MSEQQHIENNKRPVHDDEIDLVELAKVIWSRKWFIAKVTSVFVVLGLIIAFTSPEEYETSCTLIPEAINESGKLGGSLGGLASMAGVDLGGLSGASVGINPALYQSVSRSTPFLLELMRQEYYFSEVGQTISIYDYYMEHMEIGLFGWLFSVPGRFIGWMKSDDSVGPVKVTSDSVALSLTKKEQSIIENLKSRVFVEMDWDLNVVTVKVEMRDPVVSAQMAQFTQNYITDYVTDYSVSKSQQQFKSTERLYRERQKEFERTQYRLANFRDQNRNVNTARARSEEDRLQSEYNLAFNVYNQLAQQLESIKLRVEENRPVFTVLEPAIIPTKKSRPKRGVILISAGILGVILSTLFTVLKLFLMN